MEPTAPVPTESPAPPSTNPLANMTQKERSDWRADDSSFDYGGKPAETPTPQADSSPAPSAEQSEQAASTEVSPSAASEPAKPNAATRVKELLAERKQLEDRLKTLEAKFQPPPQAPNVAPNVDGFPEFDAWQAEHPTESYDRYIAAHARHEAEQVFEQRLAVQQRHQTIDARLSAWTERLNDAKKDPAFIPKLSPEVANLRPVDVLDPSEPVTPENIIAQEVIFLRNPQLMVYLSEHPDEFARVRTLPTSADIIREMGRLDERVTTGSRVHPPTPKLITSASPPPKLVNQRPAEAADPSMAAVNSGDYKAFKAAEEAAERARR